MKIIILLAIMAVLASCASTNTNQKILFTKKFKKASYINTPNTKKLRKIKTVSVVLKGDKANILNTVPQLFEEALKAGQDRSPASLKGKRGKVYISGLRLKSFTRKENFNVPYQVCNTVSEVVQVPVQSCYGSGASRSCSTTYSSQTRSKQQCHTQYRTELKDVLYQRAVADVYVRK